ncbi:MAG: response regulator [Candidatus Omnitrophota bacterium]
MANKRVLILDDDNGFLDELSEMLASNGYEPVIVSDTDGFLNLVAKIKPAVILLDLKMPKKTGFLWRMN